MDDFEKVFDRKFETIRKRTGAFLYWLHPPMRCVGTRGSMPVFVQTGRALFDVAGWLPVAGEFYFDGIKNTLPNDRLAAIKIGVELKRNKEPHPSMRIVGEDGSGSGIQAHQLEALAAVHRDGGIARVLWNNGGEIGLLDGEQIRAAHFAYGVSVAAERMRKQVAKGARSIPWKNFTKIDLDTTPEVVILPEVREPTVDRVLAKKRRDATKKIEEDARAKVPTEQIEDIAESIIENWEDPETLCDADD